MSSPNLSIRILCLHGFCSNASHLEGSLKALQKRMASAVPPIELHFLQAPHPLPIPDDSREKALKMGRRLETVQRYSWWNATDDGKEYRGWRESANVIQDFMVNNGPFHGILGFSQGAAMAAVVCAAMGEEANSELSFVIMVGGFPPRDPDLQTLLKASQKLRQIRSLHVIGEADQLVKPEHSHLVAQTFGFPSFLVHEGGHYMPSSRSHCDRVIEFVLTAINSDISSC